MEPLQYLRLWRGLVVLVLLPTFPPRSRPAKRSAEFRVVDLGVLPDAVESEPWALNDRGQVVGTCRMTSGQSVGFLNASGRMQLLELFNDASKYQCWPYSINNPGAIVGQYQQGFGETRAFLYQDGKTVDLGTLGGASSGAYDINDHGLIVGGANTKTGPGTAFAYTGGKMKHRWPRDSSGSTALAVNNRNVIAGGYDQLHGEYVREHAFVYANGKRTDIGAFTPYLSRAYDINLAGQVVGDYGLTSSGPIRAYVYTPGRKVVFLGTLGGAGSVAYGLNDRGDVVGLADVLRQGSPYHAFLYCKGRMRDLNDCLGGETGWELRVARDINNRGQIIGWGTVKGSKRAFLLEPAEPSR